MNSPTSLSRGTPLNPRALLAAVVESSRDAIIAQSPDGTILSWNTGANRIYGYSAAEAIGKNISLIVPEEKAEELASLYVGILSGEDVQTTETTRIAKDGRRVEISLTLSAIYDDQKALLGFSAIARDVTQRNKAIAADRRRQRLLTDFVENATEGLHWVGPDGTILWANRAELEAFGYKAEEYIGHNIAEFHADEPVICDILNRLTAGEKLESYEARIRGKDGRIRHVLINSSVYFEDGKFVHTRCFTRDITARHQAEEDLRAAQLKLRQYAANLEQQVELRTADLRQTIESLDGMCYTMAHDLRAPLRSIQSFTQILVSDYAPKFDEEGQLYAARILSATGRMNALIRDLMEFARVSHTKVPNSPIDLNEHAAVWHRQCAEELKTNGAELTIVQPLPKVMGSAVLVDQVFANLIVNALKFMPGDRRPMVNVSSETDGDFATLVVRDNGIGIAPENAERIFGLFQRLHTPDQYPGTGVGLAIVRKAVERMGGNVKVESTLGQGSTFRVRLRRVETVENLAPAP